jgi:hypothetical protein
MWTPRSYEISIASLLLVTVIGMTGLPQAVSASWSPEEQISPAGSLTDNGWGMACDPCFHIHIVWKSDDEIYYKEWRHGCWDNQATRLTTSIAASQDATIGTSADCRVHVIWEEFDTNAQIYHLERIGQDWQTPVFVASTALGNTSPVLAVEQASGDLHLVWENEENGPNGGIWYKKRAGTSWSSAVQIVSSTETDHPCIAVDSCGTIHVVWEDDGVIMYSEDSGGGWSSPVLIGSSYSLMPCIACSPDCKTHVVYYRSEEIYYREEIGSVWGPETPVTNAPGFSGRPNIAVDCGGCVHVVWLDCRDGGQCHIYYKRRETSWTADTRLDTLGTGGSDPCIALDRSCNAHVAWDGDDLWYRRCQGEGCCEWSGVGDSKTGSQSPQDIRVVPNPFSRSADVMLQVVVPEPEANVSVYDIGGRLVRRLVAGDLAEGGTVITWDRRNDLGDVVCPGVYFIRSESSGHICAAKIVVVE